MARAALDPYFAPSIHVYDNLVAAVVATVDDTKKKKLLADRNVSRVTGKLNNSTLKQAGMWLASSSSHEFIRRILAYARDRTRTQEGSKEVLNDNSKFKLSLLSTETPFYAAVYDEYGGDNDLILHRTVLALAYFYLVHVPSIRAPLAYTTKEGSDDYAYTYTMKYDDAMRKHPFLEGLVIGYIQTPDFATKPTEPKEEESSKDEFVSKAPESFAPEKSTELAAQLKVKLGTHGKKLLSLAEPTALSWFEEVENLENVPLLFMSAIPHTLGIQWILASLVYLSDKSQRVWTAEPKTDTAPESTKRNDPIWIDQTAFEEATRAWLESDYWIGSAAALYHDDENALDLLLSKKHEAAPAALAPEEKEELTQEIAWQLKMINQKIERVTELEAAMEELIKNLAGSK